jgi:LysM repeat protein
MKLYKCLLKFSYVTLLICCSNISSYSQSISTNIIDTVINENKRVILYDDKSWEYLSVERRNIFLNTFIDTSMIFTEKWSNIIFPYKEKSPPDSSFIKYLDSLDNFTMPCINKINSQFGYRKSGFHKGIDIHLTKGDEVKVIFNGKVRYARFNSGGYGNLVIVRHFNGMETYYAHLSKINVSENQILQSGDIVGLGGNSGAEWTSTHLHFEVRYHDFAFDPQKMFSMKDSALLSESILLKKSDFHSTIATSRKYHTIKSGETLSHLAVRYHTKVSKILNLNSNLKRDSIVRIGQKIRVR